MHYLLTSVSQVLDHRTPCLTRKEHCVLCVCVHVGEHMFMQVGSTLSSLTTVFSFFLSFFWRYGLFLDLLLISLAVTNRAQGASILCQH